MAVFQKKKNVSMGMTHETFVETSLELNVGGYQDSGSGSERGCSYLTSLHVSPDEVQYGAVFAFCRSM
jgi:hypothetical protein